MPLKNGSLALVAILVFLSIVVLARLIRSARGAAQPWPFYVRRVLTAPEQVLYHRLVRALPDHIVLAQVQVSRVLGVKKGARFQEWNNRINRLSYDFVVCAKDATVIAAIELDDRSHESPDAERRDSKKDKASRDAGLRLVRWHVRAIPKDDDIRREVLGGSTPGMAQNASNADAPLPSQAEPRLSNVQRWRP
jgi:very-short-patch-repair endonuclease